MDIDKDMGIENENHEDGMEREKDKKSTQQKTESRKRKQEEWGSPIAVRSLLKGSRGNICCLFEQAPCMPSLNLCTTV